MTCAVFLGVFLIAVLPAEASTVYDLVADTASKPTANLNGPWAFLSGSTPVPYQAYEAATREYHSPNDHRSVGVCPSRPLATQIFLRMAAQYCHTMEPRP